MAATSPNTDLPKGDQPPSPSESVAAPRAPAANDSLPPSIWTSSAQFTSGVLLVALIGLIGWRYYSDRRTKPGELVRSAEAVKSIELNRASRAELLQLPGVGQALADHILAYRESNGPFKHVDELRDVSGIGERTLARLKPMIRVDAPEELTREEPVRLVRKPQMATTPKPVPFEPIDLNRATVSELQQLPGIGPVLAQRIVAEREKKPFTSIEDLRRVSGIGPKTLEKVRQHIANVN